MSVSDFCRALLMDFEKIGEISVGRLSGKVTHAEMVQRVKAVIVAAREQQVRKLLVVTAGLTGFKMASVAERYFYVNEWVQAAGGGMTVALVTRPERRDPQRFGEVVAENLGVTSRVFVSEEEAIAWLQNPTRPKNAP